MRNPSQSKIILSSKDVKSRAALILAILKTIDNPDETSRKINELKGWTKGKTNHDNVDLADALIAASHSKDPIQRFTMATLALYALACVSKASHSSQVHSFKRPGSSKGKNQALSSPKKKSGNITETRPATALLLALLKNIGIEDHEIKIFSGKKESAYTLIQVQSKKLEFYVSDKTNQAIYINREIHEPCFYENLTKNPIHNNPQFIPVKFQNVAKWLNAIEDWIKTEDPIGIKEKEDAIREVKKQYPTLTDFLVLLSSEILRYEFKVGDLNLTQIGNAILSSNDGNSPARDPYSLLELAREIYGEDNVLEELKNLISKKEEFLNAAEEEQIKYLKTTIKEEDLINGESPHIFSYKIGDKIILHGISFGYLAKKIFKINGYHHQRTTCRQRLVDKIFSKDHKEELQSKIKNKVTQKLDTIKKVLKLWNKGKEGFKITINDQKMGWEGIASNLNIAEYQSGKKTPLNSLLVFVKTIEAIYELNDSEKSMFDKIIEIAKKREELGTDQDKWKQYLTETYPNLKEFKCKDRRSLKVLGFKGDDVTINGISLHWIAKNVFGMSDYNIDSRDSHKKLCEHLFTHGL